MRGRTRFRRLIAGFALALGLVAASPPPATAAAAPSVGFQRVEIADGASAPIQVAIWYPTRAEPSEHRLALFTQVVAQDAPVAGRRLPLVVISHGTGGELSGHYDTAQALAQAGFVVASLTHTGDNSRDQSRATDLAERPRQLRLLVDYMLHDWPPHAVDPKRVGAFGFSAGGFTVLAAAGAVPDLRRVRAHCAAHPAFFDCTLVRQHPETLAQEPPPWADAPDRRLKAIVVAAPAAGWAFDKAGLTRLTLPVQLWRAELDSVLPHPVYAEAVRLALPRPPEMHVVPGADHFDFLAPCSDALRAAVPMICTSRPGFDRAAFHLEFDREVVRFFRANL